MVKKFGAKEVLDIRDLIRAMEEYAGAGACQVAPGAGIAKIRALHDRMIARCRRGDRMTYYKLNQGGIHSGIAALAGNAALSDVHGVLRTRLKRIRFIGHEGPRKGQAPWPSMTR